MQTELIGKKLTAIRAMTDEEIDAEGWLDSDPYTARVNAVLVFEDGTKLYASRDSEGNAAGAMFGLRPDGKAFHLFMRKEGG